MFSSSVETDKTNIDDHVFVQLNRIKAKIFKVQPFPPPPPIILKQGIIIEAIINKTCTNLQENWIDSLIDKTFFESFSKSDTRIDYYLDT